VANSTVFGGIAGETVADWVPRYGRFAEPDARVLEEAVTRCRHPLAQAPGDVEVIREALYDLMWNDVGILRDGAGLARARSRLAMLDGELDGIGVAETDLRYNLTWHDWLNLKNLILVSQAITASALARENSRGAHYREDFPDPGPLTDSKFMCLRWTGNEFEASQEPVQCSRVRPGETLLA